LEPVLLFGVQLTRPDQKPFLIIVGLQIESGITLYFYFFVARIQDPEKESPPGHQVTKKHKEENIVHTN